MEGGGYYDHTVTVYAYYRMYDSLLGGYRFYKIRDGYTGNSGEPSAVDRYVCFDYGTSLPIYISHFNPQ